MGSPAHTRGEIGDDLAKRYAMWQDDLGLPFSFVDEEADGEMEHSMRGEETYTEQVETPSPRMRQRLNFRRKCAIKND